MDISAISQLYKTDNVLPTSNTTEDTGNDFSSVFNSVMQMVNETNALQNSAEAEEMSFALGETENIHDLLVAEQKANVALQYTVALRDRTIEAYREIMNMQI